MVLVFLFPAISRAEGLVFLVSTPVSPPAGLFLFIPFAFLLASGAAVFLLLRRQIGSDAAALASCLAHVCFVLLFFLWGRLNTSHLAPVSIGIGGSPLYGLTWHDFGTLFVEWNLWGLVLLAVCSFVVCLVTRPRGLRSWLMITMTPAAIYAPFVLPYAFSGVYAHGFVESHIVHACHLRLEQGASALRLYAEDHHGRLPYAEDYVGIVEACIRNEYVRDGGIDILAFCPVSRYFAKTPIMYVWHDEWGGYNLGEIPGDAVLLECPRDGYVVRVSDIVPPAKKPAMYDPYGLPPAKCGKEG